MGDGQVLHLHVLVPAGHRVDAAEVGAHVPGHRDDVHLGGGLVLAAVHLLGVYLILVHVGHHLLPLIGGEPHAERGEGVSHNLTEDQMNCGGFTDLLTGAEQFLPDPQLPWHSVVAEVDVGAGRMEPGLGLLQPLVLQLIQNVLCPPVQTIHRLQELRGLLQLKPLCFLSLVTGH